MTKRIEEVLGLPEAQKLLNDPPAVDESDESSDIIVPEYEKDDQLLLDPAGVYKHEQEMDSIIEVATEAHKDAMSLSFNMEPKHAGEIMEAAIKMLDLAFRASQSKVDMKNKSMEVALKHQKLNADLKKNIQEVSADEVNTDTPKAGSFVADRNELLAKISSPKKQN